MSECRKTCQKYSGIGGQAIIEGIMMRAGKNYSIAVRKPDGEIGVRPVIRVDMTAKIFTGE